MHSTFQISLCCLLVLCSCRTDLSNPNSELVTIEQDGLVVTINPSGAELQSIHDKTSDTEYLWQGDPEYWQARSPVMFPVNVRFKDNQFTYRETLYEMPRMGLAVNSTFEVLPQNKPDAVVLELVSSPETLKHYPFPFRLQITYRLEGNALINQFLVENTGSDSLYFALGGHPGFRFPFHQEIERSAYQYTFSDTMNTARILIAESLVQHTLIPFLDGENSLPLDDPRIPENGSGMFLKEAGVRQIGLGLKDQPPFVSVDLGDFPNVNLWSPPGRPYACIEPMLSHHDLVDAPLAIEDKSHLIALPAGKSGTYRFSIIIHRKQGQ